jgi:hypothetical protein
LVSRFNIIYFLNNKYKMAANSSAHSAKAGFNQSGGAHFIVITALATGTTLADSRLYTYTPGTGSGGATQPGTVDAVLPATLAPGLGAGVALAAVGAGKLIKDMGKTVVVNKVTYRKFQTVQTPSATGAGGQMGKEGSYYSFYLEVGREGEATAKGPAGIARYF